MGEIKQSLIGEIKSEIQGIKNDVQYTKTNIGDFWTQRFSTLGPIFLFGFIGFLVFRHYSYPQAKKRFLEQQIK